MKKFFLFLNKISLTGIEELSNNKTIKYLDVFLNDFSKDNVERLRENNNFCDINIISYMDEGFDDFKRNKFILKINSIKEDIYNNFNKTTRIALKKYFDGIRWSKVNIEFYPNLFNKLTEKYGVASLDGFYIRHFKDKDYENHENYNVKNDLTRALTALLGTIKGLAISTFFSRICLKDTWQSAVLGFSSAFCLKSGYDVFNDKVEQNESYLKTFYNFSKYSFLFGSIYHSGSCAMTKKLFNPVAFGTGFCGGLIVNTSESLFLSSFKDDKRDKLKVLNDYKKSVKI